MQHVCAARASVQPARMLFGTRPPPEVMNVLKPAYEGAARGDPSVARELHAVLAKPYDEQGAAEEERWAQPTPRWARDRPGLHVMS